MDGCTKQWWHQKKSSQIPILISSISKLLWEPLAALITKIIVVEIKEEGYICVGVGNMNEWKNIVHCHYYRIHTNVQKRHICLVVIF